ncbi:uncharacterized protein LOC114942106 [Nylanderia fulva]|uniref:uncharacterized protein LOC114942106 n=1 Tax=Nylanderia fulva TaxID=613905 RepID=UPI0010FAED6E|nr:uncharacterized protein LOC114942106 [Nylanderia fulva]
MVVSTSLPLEAVRRQPGAAVQEIVSADRWHHVPTAENPADAATRGITPCELSSLQLWWRGPPWLTGPTESWPKEAHEDVDSCEERRSHAATVGHGTNEENELLTRFSSLSKLIRVSAFCFRVLRREAQTRTTHLSAQELNDCRLRWLRIVQRQDFAGELKALTREAPLSRKSPLRALRPFLGPDGLIRVGGRLENASLNYEEKHPIVLTKRSHLSLLLVCDAHHCTLHGGPQLTRSVLARRYWVIHANTLIRAVIHCCVRCARFRTTAAQQQMGQLPADRVRTMRPFLSAGVDYAMPIQLRASKGRGHKSYKGYICLFVCMATST